MRMMLALGALSLVAAPAFASGEQSIETFDSRAVGLDHFDIFNSTFLFNTAISGGTVIGATVGHPAHSGTQVYGGTMITLVTEDEAQFSWPGVGAWVSGGQTIWLQAYEYDMATGVDNPLVPVSLSGGVTDEYLSIGSVFDPHFITKAVFWSDDFFTMDDLTLGIEGVAPGIPEPASWVMMLGGFGVVGGAIRTRRRIAIRFG